MCVCVCICAQWLLVLVMWVWCGIVYWAIEQTGHCRNQAEFTYEMRWKNVLLSIQHTCLEWAGGITLVQCFKEEWKQVIYVVYVSNLYTSKVCN